MKTQHKHNLLSAATFLACSVIYSQAQAALPTNAVLKLTDGAVVCLLGGTYPNCTYGASDVPTGSYFAMVINPAATPPKIPLFNNSGIILGKTQPASGSHTGPADGTENPGIDKPWYFSSSTGMHQTPVTPVTMISDDTNGNVTLDFSGWNVTWNGIPSINMGAGADNGIAAMTCASTCADGDTYTLDYNATVPAGDPSGFGGVPYILHLEGTISVPPALTTDATAVNPGTIAGLVGSSDGRISMKDLTDNGGVEDSGYTFGGGLYDFVITGAGATTQIMISLSAPIPANAVYRKYINGTWTTFTADTNNKIASAAKVSGSCPAIDADASYDHTNGLVEGDECLQLTIEDNGSYDSNATAGTVADPGGVAVAVVDFVDTRTWATSGCSMSVTPVNVTERADWWLVAGFLGVLAWLRGMRRKAHSA